ncbi:unnamed protein product (macronuclear) [Paramecium tetraurelia]|uniref:Cyclic nucleotide-binding domain-containing protein n=1 Tax=Paramecium tetraurelia TaxID=5888 RepID=A0CAZ8_PARTE|nr:uncharacterized protein GSPATT00036748001 [Paramecium tetraurelia]CAK67965.1 unnamed protein product [Paramecium tetraurelia]|eukprot:XP_001435362.1 hypothetical protein (macronuclear) [Paramecium tetraurelia strain d4-2]
MSFHYTNYQSIQVNKDRIDTQRELDRQFTRVTARKNSMVIKTKSIGQRILNFVGKQMSVDYQERLVLKSLQAQNVNAKKFLEILLKNKHNLKNLKHKHLAIINDKAQGNIDKIQTQSTFKIFIDRLLKKRLLRIFKPIVDCFSSCIIAIPLLYPENRRIIVWDIIAILSKLYFLYLIPLELAWTNQSLMFNRYYTSTIAMLIILFVDFLIGLNTAYYNAGSLIIDRLNIFKHQISKSYGLEWISTLLLAMLFIVFKSLAITTINVTQNPSYLILLTVLSHQTSVHYKASEYEQALNLSKKASSCLELLKFLLLLFYVIHLFSCLWFWVGNYSRENCDLNWLDSLRDIPILDWTDEYLQSFYYTCVTMFTIGYGDIAPKSGLEKSTCIFLILVSSIQLPYSINTVGSIIEKITDYGEDTKNKLRTINSYMNKKKVPYNLQNQIRQYLNHYWESIDGQDTEEEKVIISQLSENLREQLIIQANSQIFQKVPLLQKNFSLQFQQNLLKKVNSLQLQPEQIIDLDSGDIQLYFVDEGEINILIESGQIIETAKKDDIFGLKNLFVGNIIRNKKLKSVGFTKLLVLSRNDVLQELKDFPIDYEKFCHIKDDLIFNSKSSYIHRICESCSSSTHEIPICPLLHFIPQRDLIIKRCQYPLFQTRKVFCRTPFKSLRLQNQLIENQDLNEIKQQYIKKYHIPQQQQATNNNINTISLQNGIPEDYKESRELKTEHQLNSTAQASLKRDSVIALSQIPGDHIEQIKRTINNHNRNRNRTIKQISNKQIDYQLDGMGILKQNSLASRRQSQGLNIMNIYQLGLNNQNNNSSFKQNYAQELLASTINEINIDEELKQRYENLKQIKNMNISDRESIELLYFKQKNLQKYMKKGLTDFEVSKIFHDYYPQHNVDRQIKRISKNTNALLQIMIKKYISYLQYPAEFIKAYNLSLSYKYGGNKITEEENS